MSNQKKQIILNEIAFWKKSKMLPERYCDFLTTLYSEGNAEIEAFIPDQKQSIMAKKKKASTRKFVAYPILTVSLLLVLSFIEIDWLTISIGALLAAVLSYFAIRMAIKKHVAAPLLHMSATLILLALSVKIAITYFEGNNEVLFAILAGNCVIWLLTGILQRLIYFTIAGGLGLVVIIGYSMFFL